MPKVDKFTQYGYFHQKFKHEMILVKTKISPSNWWPLEYCRQFSQAPTTKIIPEAPFYPTQINLNSNMDKKLHTQQSVIWNHLSIPKFQQLYRWSLGMDK